MCFFALGESHAATRQIWIRASYRMVRITQDMPLTRRLPRSVALSSLWIDASESMSKGDVGVAWETARLGLRSTPVAA